MVIAYVMERASAYYLLHPQVGIVKFERFAFIHRVISTLIIFLTLLRANIFLNLYHSIEVLLHIATMGFLRLCAIVADLFRGSTVTLHSTPVM